MMIHSDREQAPPLLSVLDSGTHGHFTIGTPNHPPVGEADDAKSGLLIPVQLYFLLLFLSVRLRSPLLL